MSAFMCNAADFATLAKFAIDHQCAGVDRHGAPRKLARVANMLGEENRRSVNYRYAEQERYTLMTGAEVRAAARNASAAQIVELCKCVRYQSNERPDYEQTAAAALLNDIEAVAAKMPAGASETAAAAWGLQVAL